jgi:hypothetical protein
MNWRAIDDPVGVKLSRQLAMYRKRVVRRYVKTSNDNGGLVVIL